MIAYLLLSAPLRKRVQRIVLDHTKDGEAALAVQTVIEEFGDDEQGLRQALQAAEEKLPAPGLTKAILTALAGESTSSLDWRLVPRHPKNKRRI